MRVEDKREEGDDKMLLLLGRVKEEPEGKEERLEEDPDAGSVPLTSMPVPQGILSPLD